MSHTVNKTDKTNLAFRYVMMAEIDRQGQLPAFTSIGCYTLIYLTGDGDILCACCAEDEILDEDMDPPVARDVFWEGPPEYCVRCDGRIESSYGDPDDEGRMM